MTYGIVLDAVSSNRFQDFGLLLFKILATAGGAGVGAVATGWLVRGLSRFLVRRTAPPWILWLRWLGAAAGGLAVWVWVFGPGGGGWGGPGGGMGAGGNGGETSATASKSEQGNTRPESDRAEILRIAIVRSTDYVRDSKRYYLVEGDKSPHSVSELLDILKERQKQNPALKIIEVVIYRDSVAEDWGYLTDLEKRAKPLGFKVLPSRPDRDMP